MVSLDDIEHVHFERVGFNNKNFDIAIIFKEGRVEKGADEFVRISAIPMSKLDDVKDWLLEIVEKVCLLEIEPLRKRLLLIRFRPVHVTSS